VTPPDDVPTALASATEPRRFDRFSLGMYGAFLLWGWLLYAFGPVIQILGREVGFTAAQIGLHGTAMAAGTALAGGALAAVVNALGWLVLGLATAPTVAVLGLAVAGMGCGLLYPFAASLMLSTARGSKDSAQGLIMVSLGVAVAIVPFVLGVLADALGVHLAFTLIAALAAVGAVAAALGAATHRPSAPGA